MAAPFSYPEANVSGIVDFFQYVNSTTDIAGTGGFLGVAILLAVGFVSFLTLKAYSADRAIGFSSFLVMIIALLLRTLSLINDYIFGITIVIFIGSLIFLIRERHVEEQGV